MTGADADGWNRECRRTARRLAVQAGLACLVVMVAAVVLVDAGAGIRSNLGPAKFAAAVLGVAVLAAAGHAALDAWLFRLMASHANEERGGAAVDRLLSRLLLVPARKGVRPAAARIAGARGVLRRLWLALAAFLAATALAAIPFAAKG